MSDCIGTGCKSSIMQEQIEALRRERDELKRSVSFWASHTPTDAYCDDLAASQAYAAQLREALESCDTGGYRDIDGDWCERYIFDKNKIYKALALPHDDTALRQYGAKLLREAADNDSIYDGVGRIHRSQLRRMADELKQS